MMPAPTIALTVTSIVLLLFGQGGTSACWQTLLILAYPVAFVLHNSLTHAAVTHMRCLVFILFACAQAGKDAKQDLLRSAFSEEALDEAGARREAPPFAIVASTDYDLSVGRCAGRTDAADCSAPHANSSFKHTFKLLARMSSRRCMHRWRGGHAWRSQAPAQTALPRVTRAGRPLCRGLRRCSR